MLRYRMNALDRLSHCSDAFNPENLDSLDDHFCLGLAALYKKSRSHKRGDRFFLVQLLLPFLS